MDIELLRTFIEVNRTGHFGRAADNLFLTQSAVSARIKMLEEALGVIVFERKRNDIRLTSSGNRFLKHAKSIVDTWQLARQDVSLQENFVSTLAIGSLIDLWELELLNWLSQLRMSHPEIAFYSTAYPAEIITSQLLNNTLDVAVVFEHYFSPEIENRFVKRIELVMASSSPVNIEQAFDENYIMVNWGTAYTQNHAKLFEQATVTSMYMSHGSLALQFILDHMGTAYLPRQWVEKYETEKRLFPVTDAPVIEREIYASWRRDNDKLPVISKFLESAA